MNTRKFIPSKPDLTTVKCWTWKRGRGLWVEYKDGSKCRSSWTLRELLEADHKAGDGLPCKEVVDGFGSHE